MPKTKAQLARKEQRKRDAALLKRAKAEKAERKFLRKQYPKEINNKRYQLKKGLDELVTAYFEKMNKYGGEPNKCPGRRTVMPGCSKISTLALDLRRAKKRLRKTKPIPPPLNIPPKNA